MKRIIAMVVFLLASSASLCFCSDVPCVAGNCQRWSINALGRSPDGVELFHFENNTGAAAFDVTVVINVYDYFGHYIKQITWRNRGPIHKILKVAARLPEQMYKWTGEIYYKNNYTE